MNMAMNEKISPDDLKKAIKRKRFLRNIRKAIDALRMATALMTLFTNGITSITSFMLFLIFTIISLLIGYHQYKTENVQDSTI
jgi:hypothetical protein